MADNRQETELLFFETFSHENAEELNLDLVQFPRPVVISEVRVVPLQTRVQADVRGGERLGATNPSSFKLELFVNNLSRPNASTFEMLGLMDYKANAEIQLMTEVKIPTDGLILKGWYKTLTIAIYGVLTNVSVEQETLPPPPPPQPRKQVIPSQQPVPLPVSQSAVPSHRPEHQEWESPGQKLTTPHTTQHPLDYIQQQLQQQANIQSGSHTVSASLQSLPVMAVTLPPPVPGQMSLPGSSVPIKQESVYHQDDYSRHLMEKDLFSPGAVRDLKAEPKDLYDTREPYDDSRSRDSWSYHDNRGSRERVPDARDYPSNSREGSHEPRDRDRDRDCRDSRDREYRDSREYREDWDKGRDKEKDRDRDKKSDYDRDRDNKDRRGYEDNDRGARGYEGRDSKYDVKLERELDQERDREYERDRDRDAKLDSERDRGRDYDRGRDFDRSRDSRGELGRDTFRDMERGRERETDRGPQDRQDDRSSRDWEGDHGSGIERDLEREERGREDRDLRDMDRSVERVRDVRDRTDSRAFRDRTRDDYRKLEKPREVYMETEAPRSPSRSRSRSFSPDQVSSHSPSPHIPTVEPRPRLSPSRQLDRGYPRRGMRESQNIEVLTVVKEVVLEEPMSPSPDEDAPLESESPGVPFEAMSPENIGSPMEQAYMSDYEAISSEDEFIDIEGDLGLEYEVDEEAFSYITAPFNPYQFEAISLTTYSDVAATPFEEAKARYLRGDYVKPDTRPAEAQQLLDIVDKFSTADHHDSWVEAMESVPGLLPLGLSYLMYKERRTDVLQYLIQWMVEGLDEQKAIAQPQSAYKVRHLKMGFKLAGALCCCDADICVSVLREDVQLKLLTNFQSQFMSFSLKLQIVAALDQTTRLKDGINWYLGVHHLQTAHEESPSLSCYQLTVKCLLQKQVVRVVVAMTALIKKIHTYEVMNKLAQQVHSIVERSQQMTDPKVPCEEGEDAEMDASISEADIDAITMSLEEINKVFTLANTLLAQPGRTLPGKAMFDTKPGPVDPLPGLFHIADTKHLLECVLFLVSCPSTLCVPTLFASVRSLLQKWLSCQEGLLYLAARPDVTNKIVQALVQMADYNRDEVTEENVPQRLGLELIFKLQTLIYVDKLYDYHKVPGKNIVEDQLPITILHTLYTMSFTLLGRNCLVQVLSYNNNIKCLLPFVEQSGNEREDARLKKSVCSGYTTELLNIVVHYTDNVTFLEKHGNLLLTLGESEFSSKLTRLKEWLAPMKSISSISSESLSTILDQLKTYADDIQKLPRGLITVLRILKHLAIPPPNDYPDEKADEMKHKFVLLELFSGDCFPICFSILQKLSDLMLRPWQKGIPRSMELLSLYLSLVRPCLEIIKVTTQYLIMARGAEFRDLTTLPVLFDLHTVLCSVPASTIYIPEIQAIQRDIIDTIAAYTQPLSEVAGGAGDKISQSLWTLAMRDLLKFTMKAPYTYLSGLLILSELLPLPLPLQTKEPLSPAESSLALNTRKLWSAHLLPLHGALHSIIHTLSVTSCQPLQQILRKICWQMSDLAAPTATMITQCILDILLEHIESGQRETKDGKQGPELDDQKAALASRGRVLNLLAYLLSQPAIKCTILRLMGSDGEEKYQSVLSKMLAILNEVTDRPEHVQDQECVVSILQSLFDTEVTLTSGETCISIEQQVANSLPTSDQLTMIIEALLEHIAEQNHKYDTVLPCVRALVMLTEHDYSFYLIKVAFGKHKTALFQLLQRIQSKFSKDSSDCLSTFSTTLEFLRLLVTADPPMEDMPLTRTITLSAQELCNVVNWQTHSTTHPLIDLQKHLEDCVKEEETLDSLLDSVNSLLTILRKDSPQTDTPELLPIILPEPELLPNLFNIRSTYTVTDPDDERLTSTFWQTTFEHDDPDLIPCDLDTLCKKYCNDFNLEEELKKDSMTSEEELTKPKKLKDRRKSQEYVSWRGRGMRRPFVAPMRGRGIARVLAAQANRHDPFRSRPPNTSRPPSMHVDDFMKLEKSSASREESPTNNTAGVRREGEFGRGRGGRGFDRGRGGFDRGRGGRFMTPPGSFRRDAGGFRGAVDSGEGGGLYGTRSKPPFVSPRSFTSRGHERSISGERRDVRGGRFEPQRGRGSWNNRGGGWPMPRFKDDRFSAGVGNSGPSFRGNRTDPGRHQRSFTK